MARTPDYVSCPEQGSLSAYGCSPGGLKFEATLPFWEMGTFAGSRQ
jgi:hypothetical protein